MIRVCFVCLGNICRSPTAEGVMRFLVEGEGLDVHVDVDSAGTAAYHVGERADRRSAAAARKRGITLAGRSRQFVRDDWERFDYVLAMDSSNYDELARQAPSTDAREKLHLFRDFDPTVPKGSSTPDPYYGGPQGFDEVVAICEAGCIGLLRHLRKTHGL